MFFLLKWLIQNAEIRDKTSALLQQEAEDEEANVRRRTKDAVIYSSEDEGNPGDIITKDPTDDSDSQMSGLEAQSQLGVGNPSDDENPCSDREALGFQDDLDSEASTWNVTFADIILSSE